MKAGDNLDKFKKSLVYGKEPEYWIRGGDNTRDCSAALSHLHPEMVHAIIGIATEASELCEALVSSINTGEPIDETNLLEEIGDLMWYQAIGLRALKSSFSAAGAVNIAKLAARFPGEFTKNHALNRDLDKEREVLEDGATEQRAASFADEMVNAGIEYRELDVPLNQVSDKETREVYQQHATLAPPDAYATRDGWDTRIYVAGEKIPEGAFVHVSKQTGKLMVTDTSVHGVKGIDGSRSVTGHEFIHGTEESETVEMDGVTTPEQAKAAASKDFYDLMEEAAAEDEELAALDADLSERNPRDGAFD